MNERTRGLLKPTDLRPTLIIGLGGTGKKVLTRLRALYQLYFGDVPRERVRLLELDIDPAREIARLDDQEVELREDEKIDLGDVPAHQIIEDVRKGKHPPLQNWLHKDIRLMEMNLRRGGQQIRQLGRLAFVWHAEPTVDTQNLRDKFEKVIASLTRLEVVSTEPLAIQIFVVSSLCGGTGSGMFIDVAYMLRDILEGRGLLGKSFITAFLTTPTFFSSAPQENLRPNAWAALRELDYFIRVQGNERRVQPPEFLYFRDRRIPTENRPFHITYLIDAIDHEGRNIATPEHMERLVSSVIFALSASRIGEEAASRINNVRATQDVDRGTVYSTLGYAAYVIPIDEIIGIAAARLLESELLKLIEGPKNEEGQLNLTRQVERVLTENRERLLLDVRSMANRLKPEQVDRWRAIARVERGHLESLEREALLSSIRRRLQQYRPKLAEEVHLHVSEGVNQVQEAFRDVLREIIEEYLSGERLLMDTGGIPFLDLFLAQVHVHLDRMFTQVTSERNEMRTRLERLEQTVAIEERKLQESIERSGGFLNRLFSSRSVWEDAEAYVNIFGDLLQVETDLNIYDGLRRILASLVGWVEEQQQKIARLKENIENVVRQEVPLYIREMDERILGMDPVREFPLLSREEQFKSLYMKYWDKALSNWRERLSNTGVISWLDINSADSLFRTHLLKTARQSWLHLYDAPEFYVEEVILSGREMTPEKYLKHLNERASYFWQTLTSEAVARGEIREVISVYGVADQEQSIFSQYLTELMQEQGNSVISTGDPYRVTVVKMAHGITYDTLSMRDLYINDYARAIERVRPIHVFPDFYLGDVDAVERRQAVALAWAYGILEREIDKFYFSPVSMATSSEQSATSRFERELLTEQGLFHLLWLVARDDDLYQKIQTEIRHFEARIPLEERLPLLEKFEPIYSEDKVLEEGWLAEILQRDIRRLYDKLKPYVSRK